MNDSDARPLASCTRPNTVINIYNPGCPASHSLHRNENLTYQRTNLPHHQLTVPPFKNLPTLRKVNKTEALAPIFFVAEHVRATKSTAMIAVSLIDHCGTLSGDTSSRVICHISRLRYSAKIRLMAALPPAKFKEGNVRIRL